MSLEHKMGADSFRDRPPHVLILPMVRGTTGSGRLQLGFVPEAGSVFFVPCSVSTRLVKNRFWSWEISRIISTRSSGAEDDTIRMHVVLR